MGRLPPYNLKIVLNMNGLPSPANQNYGIMHGIFNGLIHPLTSFNDAFAYLSSH